MLLQVVQEGGELEGGVVLAGAGGDRLHARGDVVDGPGRLLKYSNLKIGFLIGNTVYFQIRFYEGKRGASELWSN